MLEGYHYQNAYITRDIEKAIALFEQKANVRDVMRFEGEVELITPPGTAVNKLAFIWVDNLQYELIEPVSGQCQIYTDALPNDDALLFHHSCTRVADWDVFRKNVEQQNYPVVLEGGSDALKYVYLDARDFLGHYLEYVWMIPERWAAMGGK